MAQYIASWFTDDMNNWFARAGQFGDHFGFLTCIAAGIAAVFSYKAYQSQREQLAVQKRENIIAERERHFFRLHDDFKESLVRSRSIDSEPMGIGVSGAFFASTKAIERAEEILRSEEISVIEDESNQVDKFVERIGNIGLFGAYNFSECVIKFAITLDYLNEIRVYEKSGFYDLYYGSLVGNLLELEAKAMSIFLIDYGVRKRSPKPFTRTRQVFGAYIKLMLEARLTDREAMICMSTPYDIRSKLMVIRNEVKNE